MLATRGLVLGIDFTSGSLLRMHIPNSEPNTLDRILAKANLEQYSIQTGADSTFLIRTTELELAEKESLVEKIVELSPESTLLSFSSVGPVVGAELTRNAILAIVVASIAILLYVTWSFRNVDNPVLFGIAAIVALVHDTLILLGSFSLLGILAGISVDSMFVTAVLTVVGFSVHDTIVVFDRIRENRSNYNKAPFSAVVNYSLNQTLDRSLNTSLTAIFVLTALLILGGPTIREFVLALLIGIVVGTYSSIFTASQLLVTWDDWRERKLPNSVAKIINARRSNN
tara:strand:- start:483 stop:1337 length:855 start_codon:yes stop_codon:yes gene_type:complete